MLNCIYDVFLTCDKNNCPDLVVMALPMFVADAMNNTREYVADETDIAMWHEKFMELNTQEDAINVATKEIREFIGRHYDALVDAFKQRNRATFDAVVAECIKADEEAQKEKKQEQQDET